MSLLFLREKRISIKPEKRMRNTSLIYFRYLFDYFLINVYFVINNIKQQNDISNEFTCLMLFHELLP